MKRINWRSVFRNCSIWLSIFLFPFTNTAQVTTIVRLDTFAVDGGTAGDLQVTIRNNRNINSYLQFDLSTIPQNAKIESCVLLLVLDTVPPTITSVRVKQVLDNKLSSNNLSGQIALRQIYASRYKESDTLAFRSLTGTIERSLQQELASNDKKITFQLSTAYKNAPLSFYSSVLPKLETRQNPGFIPRLVVQYSPAPGGATWANSHADAQHTSRSSWRSMGPKANQPAVEKIYQLQAPIQKDMVMYKGRIYLIAPVAASYFLYAIDPITKAIDSLQLTEVKVPDKMPAVDPFGIYYHITAQAVDVINLENNVITHPIKLPGQLNFIKASPTLGPDGTLYLSTSLFIYAYSPYPKHQLLWQYNPRGKNISSVTLSVDGGTAYVVTESEAQDARDGVIAINTINGRGTRVPVDLVSSEDGNMMIPAVNQRGQLFITNGFPQGNALYIFDKQLRALDTIKGNRISQPSVAADGTVFYVKDGTVFNYTRDGSVRVASESVGDVNSIVTDAGNNVYLLTDTKVFGFKKPTSSQPPGNSPKWMDITHNAGLQRAMMVAPDGSIYSASSTALYTIRSRNFTPASYTVSASDLLLNKSAFHGQTLTLTENINSGYQQMFIGAESVNINSVEIKAGAKVTLISGGTISFQPGFRLQKGAELSCKTGY
jgi:hypothetical protein